MQGSNKLTLFDRLAIALLSGVFGLVTSAVIWFVVALATNNPAGHWVAFVFATSAFAAVGFTLGLPFADVLGVWFQGIWSAANAWTLNWEFDLGPEPFRPIWATVFLASIVAITVWLSLP